LLFMTLWRRHRLHQRERQSDVMISGSGNFRFLINSLAAVAVAVLAACDAGPSRAPVRKPAQVRQVSAGDVALDSATQAVNAHWLTDSNVVALLGVVGQRQMDLAHAEMQAWASDTVEALAANMLHTYQAQQQSLDSLAGALKIAGTMPAVGVALDTSLQQRTAVLSGLGAARLDSAFIATAQAQDAWAAGYMEQLSAVATAPELAAFAATAANRARLQLQQIQQFVAQRAASAKALSDSAAHADSTRRRSRRGGER
jgi:hypothetical protein